MTHYGAVTSMPAPSGSGDPQLEASTGWVEDNAGVIHFYEWVYDENAGSSLVQYFDAPGGSSTTPSLPVAPLQDSPLPFLPAEHKISVGKDVHVPKGAKAVFIHLIYGRIEINGFELSDQAGAIRNINLGATESDRSDISLPAIKISQTIPSSWQWIAIDNVEVA